jgi:hypothetical protein
MYKGRPDFVGCWRKLHNEKCVLLWLKNQGGHYGRSMWHIIKFPSGSLNVRDHLRDLGADGRIILK